MLSDSFTLPFPSPRIPFIATPPGTAAAQISASIAPQPSNVSVTPPRTLVQRVSEVLNVKDFGPCGTTASGIVANSTPAFNALFAQVRTSFASQQNTTFRIIIPNDYYYCAQSINMTGLTYLPGGGNNNSIVIEGNGATIVGAMTGGIVWDGFNSNFIKIYDLNITSGISVGATGIPSLAFAAGVADTAHFGVANNLELHNVNMQGDFSLAGAYFLCTETSSCYNLRIYNTDASAASYCLITDGQNHFGVNSIYAPNTLPIDTAISFNSMSFFTPDLRHSGGGCARWIGATTAHRYLGGYIGVSANVPATVLWLSQTGGGGISVVDLYDDIHVETSNCTDVYLLAGPQAAPPLYGLTYIDPGPQVSNSIFKCAPSVTGPYASDIRVKLVGYSNPALKMWDNSTLWSWTGDISVPNGGTICDVLPPFFEGRLAVGHEVNANLKQLTVRNAFQPNISGLIVGQGTGTAAVAAVLGAGVTLSGGNTLSVSSLAGGTVTSITAAGLLSGGTITNSGTIAFNAPSAGIVASSGSALAPIVIGTNLVFSGNTLSATGGGGSGTVTQIVAGAGLAGGTITSAGTVSLGTISAGTLLGNSSTSSASPSAQLIGAGLTLNSTGTLTSSWTAPYTTALGSGLTLAGTTLRVAPPGIGLIASNDGTLLANAGIAAGLAYTGGALWANWQLGTVTALGSGVTLSSGTLSSPSSGGTVTQIVAGAGLSGGTITSSGTISFSFPGPGIVASSGSALSPVTIGSGVSFSGGVLSATGSGGTVTNVVGAGLLSGTITTAGTIFLAVPAAGIVVSNGTTISAGTIGTGLAFNSGTLSLASQTAGTLLGNYGTIGGPALPISVGGGLSLSSGGVLSVTAAGTSVDGSVNTTSLNTQGTAYTLNKNVTVIGTGTANTGVKMPIWSANSVFQVANRCGAVQNAWPDSGSAIEGAGTNNPVSIFDGGSATFVATTTGLWRMI